MANNSKTYSENMAIRVYSGLSDIEKVALLMGRPAKNVDKRKPLVLQENLLSLTKASEVMLQFYENMAQAEVGTEIPIIMRHGEHYFSVRCYKQDPNTILTLMFDSTGMSNTLFFNLMELIKKQSKAKLLSMFPEQIAEHEVHGDLGQSFTAPEYLQADDDSCLFYAIKTAKNVISTSEIISDPEQLSESKVGKYPVEVEAVKTFKFPLSIIANTQIGRRSRDKIKNYLNSKIDPEKQDFLYKDNKGNDVWLFAGTFASKPAPANDASDKYRNKAKMFICELCDKLVKSLGARSYMPSSFRNWLQKSVVEKSLNKEVHDLIDKNTVEGLLKNGSLSVKIKQEYSPNDPNTVTKKSAGL